MWNTKISHRGTEKKVKGAKNVHVKDHGAILGIEKSKRVQLKC